MPKKKVPQDPPPSEPDTSLLPGAGPDAEHEEPLRHQTDPDAPADEEPAGDDCSSEGPDTPFSQTDPTLDADQALGSASSGVQSENLPVSQTDPEDGPDAGGPGTPLSGRVIEDPVLRSTPDLEMSDLELAREEERAALQTDPVVPPSGLAYDAGAGSEAAEPPSGQTEPELDEIGAAGSLPALQHDPVPGGEDVPGDQASDLPQPDPGDGIAVRAQRPKIKAPTARGPKVVAIDEQRQVETDADKVKNDLLDLAESLKGKRILTGTIQGVEQAGDNPNLIYAVVYHGSFKVIIPALQAVFEPVDYRDQPKNEVLYYLLNKRLGAEVDYIVQGVDTDSGIAVASRLEAMAQKRKDYYFRADRDGNYQLYEGVCAEARVTSVIRAGMFVDLFGAECYIPLAELSYQRWMDATAHYQPGQRVLVKILEIDRSDRDNLRVTVSVKQAAENPYEQALKRFVVGMRYVGTVSLVNLTGVFVSLEGGIDCLCTYPKRGRPPRGAQVTVRILGIDTENNRIWGVITHMSGLR